MYSVCQNLKKYTLPNITDEFDPYVKGVVWSTQRKKSILVS